MASNLTEKTMIELSMPSVIRVNIPNNSPIQYWCINFDNYIDNKQTGTPLKNFSNNEPDIGGSTRNDNIETSITVEVEKELEKRDGGGVIKVEEAVLHNNHLISLSYDMYSSSSSESSTSNSYSSRYSDYKGMNDKYDTIKAPIVGEREKRQV